MDLSLCGGVDHSNNLPIELMQSLQPDQYKATSHSLMQLGNQDTLVILANQKGSRIYVYADNEVKIFDGRLFKQLGTLEVDG